MATLFLNVLTLEAKAATYYASPTGNPAAAGTQPDPTTVLRALGLASAGDTVFLLAGDYILTAPVVIRKPLHIVGEGETLSMVHCETDCLQINSPRTDIVTIESLSFTGNSRGRALHLVKGDVEVDHITVSKFASGIYENSAQPVSLSVAHSTFIKTNGINTSQAYVRNVSDSIFKRGQGTYTAIRIGTPDNAIFGNSPTISIINNTIRDGMDYGMSIFNQDGGATVTIEGNNIHDTQNGISIEAFTHDVNFLIRDNRINETFETAIKVAGEAIQGTIEGNRITNSYDTRRSEGISVYFTNSHGTNPNPILVFNNLIQNYNGTGINITSSNAEVAYNTITKGMYIPAQGPHNRESAGIYTQGNVNALIVNNIVQNSDDCGQYCYGFWLAGGLVSYGGNNSEGYITIAGDDHNYGIGPGIQSIDLGNNTSVFPPFTNIVDFDLTQAFPADASLYLLADDIDGQPRGLNPDKGAFQH